MGNTQIWRRRPPRSHRTLDCWADRQLKGRLDWTIPEPAGRRERLH